MTLRLKIELIAAAVLLLGGVVGAKEWLSEHDARIKAESVVEAQKALQTQYQQQVSDLAKQMADQDAAYKAQIKSLDARFQAAASPVQVAALVSQLMGLKQPIQIVTPSPTPDNPHPTPVAQVDLADAPQAKAYLQECESCKLNLAKANADAADREQQAALAQKQIDSLKTENTSLQTALKGGTWFSRVRKAGKYIFWGAVGGGVAICGSGHCK